MQHPLQETERAILKRKGKFFLALPIIVLPFITLLLWSMGFIGKQKTVVHSSKQDGPNLSLPQARPNADSNWTKLQFYTQATKEAKATQQASVVNGAILPSADSYAPSNNAVPNVRSISHNKVQEAYQQLASLNKVLTENKQQQNEQSVPNTSYENELPYPSIPPMNATQLQRLENLNQLSSQSDQPDAETLKLNSMLDKVLDIQHPQRWKDKQNPKENSNDSIKLLKAQPFVMAVPIGSVGHPAISSLPGYTASDSTTVTTGFYGLSNVPVADTLLNNMQAVVYRDQEIVTGATVQLMLTNDILVNHILIPKNSFVFGRATLQGERLEITIPSIRYRDKILPVRLSVYDLDGLKGIYIPGTINRDGSKQGADRAIQSIGLSSLNPSVSAEAAAAGIETAKSLLSKKVKLVRVELKAGYQVLLFDENNE